MTVEVNLLAALMRVRHTKEEVQDPEQQQQVVEFKADQLEHGKRYTKTPLVLLAIRKTS